MVVGGALFEGGEVLAVEAVGRVATHGPGIALVELQAHFAGHALLHLVDEGLHGFAFGREPEAVVDGGGVAGQDGLAGGEGFAVEADAFEVLMGDVEDSAGGGFVHAAALHAHEAVLDHVETADAVLAGDLVELFHHLAGSETLAVQGDGVALFEADGDVFRFVGSLFHGHGHHIAVGAGFFPRILKLAAFEGAVQHIAVHAVVLVGRAERDVVLFSKGDESGTAHEIPFAPGSDDLKIGSKSVHRKFETHLVVALAGSAVSDGHSAFLAGDLHKALADEGTGHGSAEQVAAFIEAAGAEHGVDIVFGELVAKVFDIGLGSAGLEGLGLDAVEIVFLAEVGGDGDDFIAVFDDEPLEDDGGIETAGICEDDLLVSHAETSHAHLRAHLKVARRSGNQGSRTAGRNTFFYPGERAGASPPEKGKSLRETANFSFKKIQSLCKVLC